MNVRTLSFMLLAAGIWVIVLYFPIGKEALLLLAAVLFTAAWHLLDSYYSRLLGNNESKSGGVYILYALALWLASLACLVRGHDAPGGWCRRCGLPVKEQKGR